MGEGGIFDGPAQYRIDPTQLIVRITHRLFKIQNRGLIPRNSDSAGLGWGPGMIVLKPS